MEKLIENIKYCINSPQALQMLIEDMTDEEIKLTKRSLDVDHCVAFLENLAIIKAKQNDQEVAKGHGRDETAKFQVMENELGKIKEELWKEDYTFSDFQYEYLDDKPLNPSPELKYMMKRDLLKCVRLINKGKRSVLMKVRTHFTSKKKFGKKHETYYIITYYDMVEKDFLIHNGKKFIEFQPLNNGKLQKIEYKILEMVKDKVFQCEQVKWVPYSEREINPYDKSKVLNTFSGFKAKLLKYDPKIIKPILDHIKIIFSKGDEKVYDWFINWFACSVQEPAMKQPAMIITGAPGSGKTTFIDWFGEHVYGRNLYAPLNSLDDMLQKFNAHISSAMLINVQELKAGDDSNYREAKNKNDNFKSLITDGTFKLEKKYHDAEIIEGYAKIILNSNWENPIYIPQDDRRIGLFATDNRYSINFEIDTEEEIKRKQCYHTEMISNYKSEVGNHFYSFLMDFKADEELLWKIPQTTELQNCKEENLDTFSVFFRKFFKGDINPVELSYVESKSLSKSLSKSFSKGIASSYGYSEPIDIEEDEPQENPFTLFYKVEKGTEEKKTYYAIGESQFFIIFENWTKLAKEGKFIKTRSFHSSVKNVKGISQIRPRQKDENGKKTLNGQRLYLIDPKFLIPDWPYAPTAIFGNEDYEDYEDANSVTSSPNTSRQSSGMSTPVPGRKKHPSLEYNIKYEVGFTETGERIFVTLQDDFSLVFTNPEHSKYFYEGDWFNLDDKNGKILCKYIFSNGKYHYTDA